MISTTSLLGLLSDIYMYLTVSCLCISVFVSWVIMPDEALLLYTRRYLAQSHLLIPQPNTHCRLPPLAPIIDIRDPFAFSPCEDLDAPPPPPSQSEKLVLEYDTAIYLSSILSAPDDGEKLLCGDFRWSVARRIEVPLVEEKRKKKTHRVREDTLKDLPLGMGGDTGILWDRNVRCQVQDYVRNEEAEKMSIGPEVLQFLQDVHRPKTPPSTMEVVMEEVKYCRVKDPLEVISNILADTTTASLWAHDPAASSFITYLSSSKSGTLGNAGS